MLTSYFDEAGGADYGFTVVCGWVSTVEQWEGFEADWKLFLSKYGVPYLHVKEILSPGSKGKFSKWRGKESLKAKFFSDAAEIMRSRIRQGFVSYASHADFATVDSLFDLRSIYKNPYAIAGRSAMEMANDWRKKGNHDPAEIEHFFEDGPKDDINSLVYSMTSIEPYLPIPHIRPGRDVEPCLEWPEGRVEVVQLQPSDYLAYEVRKIFFDFANRKRRPLRKSFRAILGIPIIVGDCRAMNLARFCYAHNIARRLPENSEIYAKFST